MNRFIDNILFGFGLIVMILLALLIINAVSSPTIGYKEVYCKDKYNREFKDEICYKPVYGCGVIEKIFWECEE
jgi:hypothetical protein